MARRPRTGSHEQLSTQELAALRKQLSGMPPHELEIYYKASYAACQYNVRLPSPRLIQEFVQAWRELRTRTLLER
ncbi:MAG TPA: hypothetical protein DEQ47_09480 [Solibacterales bacterium]|nr:hypothetical protein [Bryobacterales bacterium]